MFFSGHSVFVKKHSNALANITRHLVGSLHNFADLKSLRNVAFHWLASEHMQLPSGFMQLAATGRMRNKVHFHCRFEGKMLIVH